MTDLLRHIPGFSRVATALGADVRELTRIQEETEAAMERIPPGLLADEVAAHRDRLRRTRKITRGVIYRIHGFCHLAWHMMSSDEL